MRVLAITAIMLLVLTSGLMAITIEGTVTDATNGAAIEGATVKFVFVPAEVDGIRGNGNGNGNGSGNGNGNGPGNGSGQGSGGGYGYNVFTTITDVNGEYVLTELPEGLYNVIARKTGSYPAVRFEGIEFFEDSVYDFELLPANCESPSRIRSSFQKSGK